ncbi:hypothetical protein IC232_29920 [Microvirga sp. BT688]|uniref:hypothetical protein n=1 Tax=Microvirga sp. TaxID=1873136 RepID=UPI00168305AC|nr:hypothetical protein [Microvirga sp.]MBD2750861.1 hypothetical protein [Microvirga sp.]
MPRGADDVLTRPSRMVFATMLLITSHTPAVLAQDAGAVKRFDIALENGRVAGGPQVVRIVRGDQVDILWTSNRAVTLHLHGYDIEITTTPGTPQRMTFTARATGRFPVEIHDVTGRNRALIHVEVHPR